MRKIGAAGRFLDWLPFMLNQAILAPMLLLMGVVGGGTNFKSGVRSYGVPVIGGSLPATKGSVFHVDSGHNNANATNSGADPRFPLSTIDAAVAKCTANNGDIILVSEGHTETISAAGGVDLDVAGIRVIGLGHGSDRPTITLDTAATTDVDVDAANVYIENLVFSANYADINHCIDVNATDFTMAGCHFQATATNMNFKICVQDAAANASDRLRVLRCTSLLLDAADTHFINFAGTPDGAEVSGCELFGNWGTMAIGGAGVVTRCKVLDNVIYNAASDSDSCINFASTATGICMRNLCGGAAAQANGITATAFAVAENYYGVLSEDLSAILEPIAT